MGNLVFGSGAEPGRANIARRGLTESPMERDIDATEAEKEGETERAHPHLLTTPTL